VIVESLVVATDLWAHGLWSAPDGPTFVTRDGEILDPAGVMTGGTTGATGGLLQRRREVQDLQTQLASVGQAVEDHRRLRDRLAAEGEAAKATVQRLDEAIREADLQLLAMGKDHAAFSQNVANLDRRLDTVRAERQMADEELVRIEGELAAGRERHTQLRQEQLVREAGLTAAQDILAKLDEESQSVTQRMTESRLAVAEFRAAREHCETDMARLVAEGEDHRARVAALEQQIETLAEAVRLSQSERERNEALFQELDRRGTQLRGELVSLQDVQTQDAEAARQRERELATVREALGASREARTAVEVRRAEIKTQLAALESTLTGTYQLALADALETDREAEAKEQAEVQGQGKVQVQVEAEGKQEEEREEIQEHGTADAITLGLREELKRIRERLDRVGVVNLAAIEEHRELDARYRFLTAQEEDLANSIRSLKLIISRINRTTKAMFLETFQELQVKFGEVYGRFFPGGRAELILVEPQEDEDPKQSADLEPGVDIVAQPPGKRLKNIAMLSGGEKTLTAMALIFASFLIRPTPFCILDEIDAPLDEENIGRFTGVLKELAEGAQFIVITHNKSTMAVADSLFGVTMEEPGVSKLVSVRLADLQPA
jgi:chromosome segregation protein